MANVEMVLRVADAIEAASRPDANPSLGFNMEVFGDANGIEEDKTGHNCGTVACIAGWACAVSRGDWSFPASGRDCEIEAKHILGLTAGEADELFYGRGYIHRKSIAPAVAVEVLRDLARFGEVSWPDGEASNA